MFTLLLMHPQAEKGIPVVSAMGGPTSSTGTQNTARKKKEKKVGTADGSGFCYCSGPLGKSNMTTWGPVCSSGNERNSRIPTRFGHVDAAQTRGRAELVINQQLPWS